MLKKIVCSALAVSFLFFAACSNEKTESKASRNRSVPVRAVHVATENVEQTLDVIGHVEASATVKVTAQVAGQLMESRVKPGHNVQAGDVLFQIDRRSYQASLHQAEASLASSKAELSRAKQDLARYKRLASQDFLSQQQYEQSATEVEILQASIAQKQAVRENALLQLEHTTISAPISGKVGEVLVDPGNNIKANDTPLLVINTVAPADVRFSVPERFLPELNRRFRTSTVEVLAQPEGDSGSPVSGTLTIIDNEVDRTTGSIAMRARFANDDERLWPGQFVRVSIVMESLKDALVIPESAVLEGLNGRYVYVLLEDGTVKNRNIEAVDIAGQRSLVTSGLERGERVVIDGQLNLMPGAKVEVLELDGQAVAPKNSERPAK